MLTAPSLTESLAQQFTRGCQILVVDLSGCDFLGSSGLAVLVEARERAIETSTSFALAGLNRIASRALQATGIEGLFDIYPNAGDAVAALGGESGGQPAG
jgi:anti-sigma B factor antagonist